MNSTDQKPRDQCARHSEVHPFLAEHDAASQQVAAGDPFSDRSRRSRRGRRGRKVDYPTDPRVPILARFHHLHPRKLDVNFDYEQGVGGVEL